MMRNHTLLYAILPFVVLALCQAESHSARLTAFGKTQNNNGNGQPKKNTLGRTRECKEDMDCVGIQNTTCMIDPRDGKRRCLCSDSSTPMNGACPNMPRAVRSNCNNDSECVEGSECKVNPDATTLSKMCLCKEGYEENDSLCNSASGSSAPWLMVAITTALFLQMPLRQIQRL